MCFFSLKYLNRTYYKIKLKNALESYCEAESKIAELIRNRCGHDNYKKYSLEQCKVSLYNEIDDHIYSECQEKFSLLKKSTVRKCAKSVISNFSKGVYLIEIPKFNKALTDCTENIKGNNLCFLNIQECIPDFAETMWLYGKKMINKEILQFLRITTFS